MTLRAENLGFAYRARNPVLKNLSLTLQANAMTAIVGQNGGGKTTLLKVLSGYLKPDSGQVFYENKCLSAFKSKNLAQHISFVPQDFPTDFPFRVDEFVMMGLFARKEKFFDTASEIHQVAEVLEELSLAHFRERFINHLSGGERQRVLIARALAQNTPIILLDEPLNHLDLKHRYETLNHLKKRSRYGGKTIVAVMHDLADVRRFFDDAILIKNGQLVFHGAASEALSQNRLRTTFDLPDLDFGILS